jgi:histidyl-tRNA synthetase
VLSAVDKFEKAGPEAFDAYTAKFGALPAETQAKILAFLQIRSLPDLEAICSAQGSEALQARLADWKRLLGALGAMGLAEFVSVDLGVVRGLAYYTGFVFEAFDRQGDLRALAGGGRYDDLVEKLGGPSLPAVGFAIGDMTFSLLLQERKLAPVLVDAPEVYCVLGGPAEKAAAFADIAALRAAGIRVEYPFKEIAFGKQFKAAAESGARVALIYGSNELAQGIVKLRDLNARTERDVARSEVLSAVQTVIASR